MGQCKSGYSALVKSMSEVVSGVSEVVCEAVVVMGVALDVGGDGERNERVDNEDAGGE